jgi:hypothetical protein
MKVIFPVLAAALSLVGIANADLPQPGTRFKTTVHRRLSYENPQKNFDRLLDVMSLAGWRLHTFAVEGIVFDRTLDLYFLDSKELVGTWHSTTPMREGITLSDVITYSADGKWTQKVRIVHPDYYEQFDFGGDYTVGVGVVYWQRKGQKDYFPIYITGFAEDTLELLFPEGEIKRSKRMQGDFKLPPPPEGLPLGKPKPKPKK